MLSGTGRLAALLACWLASLVPAFAAETGVAISAEPQHKIRFDNGRVRIYEVFLPPGMATLVHEHRHDSFSVVFADAEMASELPGGPSLKFRVAAGAISFASTASGPYSHRVVGHGRAPVHVGALELLTPAPGRAPDANQRPRAPFTVVAENVRGRAYRYMLAPGESTGRFTRGAPSVLFAVSSGRISESADGSPPRLWDFEPGQFRWIEARETLSVRNEGPAAIVLVEIEVF